MGLDNYWIMPGEKPHPNFDPPLNLCGGLFSNNGVESFRGKVYSKFCEEVMDINLYSESISSKELLVATKKLSSWMLTKSSYDDLNEEEINDLYRMFSTYANLGASLESWY